MPGSGLDPLFGLLLNTLPNNLANDEDSPQTYRSKLNDTFALRTLILNSC